MQNLTTPGPAAKLESARRQITRALAEPIPLEGRVPDFATAEATYKQLAGAQRELKGLAVTVGVMERRGA